MKPSPELFNLIKSLSKSEKRYFKMYSAFQAGEKNYLKLFDAIEKQEEYDEEHIKKKFVKENFIKHLPSEKNHLYNLILKSLRTFQSENSINSYLRELLKDVEILYNKALYRECNKVVNRAKKLAYEIEKYYYVLEIINWEKQLADEQNLFGSLEENLEMLNVEEQKALTILKNIAEYQVLYSKINYVFRSGGYSRNETDRKIVDEVANNYLIKGKNTAISVRATTMCYYIKGLCAITNNDLKDAQINFGKVVARMEKHPLIAKDLQRRYLRSLYYLMLSHIEYREFEDFYRLIDKMRTMGEEPEYSSLDLKIKIFTSSYGLELMAFGKKGEFSKGAEFIEKIKEELEQYKELIHKEEEVFFNYNFAYIFFGAGDYKNALYWINQVLNDSDKSGLRQDIFSFARIFNLLIHLELGNNDLLEYITKSAYRYHLKHKRVYKFENLVLKYFKRLAKLGDEDKQHELLSVLQFEMEKVFKDPNEKIILQYFDFSSWMESKLKGKPFAEIVRKKGKKQVLVD